MSAARAAQELRQGTGVSWATETDRRLKQYLALPQSYSATTTQLWELFLRKRGHILGSYASRMNLWLLQTGERGLTEAYGALRLPPYHGG